MDIYRKKRPKEKLPPGRQPKWTTEFMQMVAKKVVDEGMTYSQAAKTFNVSQGSVSKWKKMYEAGDMAYKADKLIKHVSKDYQVYRFEEQIKDLKTEIGELYLENQMLKKALCLSQTKKKLNTSVITSENLDQFREDVK